MRRNPTDRRDQQVNVRFTSAEITALDKVSRLEDRDRSYLVAFFTRWGIEQYTRVGSLTVLRATNVAHITQYDAELLSEIQRRNEEKRWEAEVAQNAEQRLELRKQVHSNEEPVIGNAEPLRRRKA